MFFHRSQSRSRIFHDLKINFLFKTRQTNEHRTDKLTNSPINFENSRSKNNEKRLLSDRCRVNREKTSKLFHRVSEQQDLHPPVEYASYISFSCSFIFPRLVTAHAKPLCLSSFSIETIFTIVQTIEGETRWRKAWTRLQRRCFARILALFDGVRFVSQVVTSVGIRSRIRGVSILTQYVQILSIMRCLLVKTFHFTFSHHISKLIYRRRIKICKCNSDSFYWYWAWNVRCKYIRLK